MQRQAIGGVRTLGARFRLKYAAKRSKRRGIANKPGTSGGGGQRDVTLRTKPAPLLACLRTRTVWVLTLCSFALLTLIMSPSRGHAQALVTVSVAPVCGQPIDGFGTTAPAKHGGEGWLHELYYGDLGASLLRVDLTPRFRAPVSDYAYNSPWFHGAPPLPGPDGNNVRSYRDGDDYSRTWSGRSAPIAVMGPDIEQNVRQFDYVAKDIAAIGSLAREGARRARRTPGKGERAREDDAFRLLGSLWSPAPWLKRSSGETFTGSGDVMPKSGTPWPFVWSGNFAGGVLDTSDQPRALFDDGTGPTSALTQFARGTAAYVLGFQRAFQVRLYALSLQNELNFETFYNSCSYPQASGYLAALKALRRELDRSPELAGIALMGPEDLLGSDAYALWQFGRAPGVHKNLQYLAAVAQDPEASRALSFFAVHAYSSDGVHSAGNDEQQWRWWRDGWRSAPAAGLPADVKGARAYGKKSWMTEMSGEPNVWSPAQGAALGDSALGLALKVHRALTTGAQSAWLYWQLLDGKKASGETLTDDKLRARSPKYVAFKHYARFIRPGACVSEVTIDNGPELHASAYQQRAGNVASTTLVLLNTSSTPKDVELRGLTSDKRGLLTVYTSHEAALWQKSSLFIRGKVARLALPARSLLTVLASEPRLRTQAVRK